MPTRAVVFDLDDTLIVEVAFAMRSLREALATLPGVDPDASEVAALEAVRSVWVQSPDHDLAVTLGFASWEGLWSTFSGNHPSLAGLEAWAPTYRVEAWRAVGASLGIDDTRALRDAADAFEEAQRRGHPVIPGMHEALARVTSRHPVGLITNGPSDIQRLKLEQSGLSGAFGGEVISGELGRGKPDATVFPVCWKTSEPIRRRRSWWATAGSATCSEDWAPGCPPSGSPWDVLRPSTDRGWPWWSPSWRSTPALGRLP